MCILVCELVDGAPVDILGSRLDSFPTFVGRASFGFFLALLGSNIGKIIPTWDFYCPEDGLCVGSQVELVFELLVVPQ
jgi:hypothetical protein